MSSPSRPDPRPVAPTDPRRSLVRRGGVVLGHTLRGARKAFSVGIAGAILHTAGTVGAALVLGRVTDEVILPAFAAGEVSRGALALAVAGIMGVALFRAVGVVGRRLGAYVGQYTLQASFRRRVTRRYLDLPLSWHRRHTTGELLSNANADVESAFFIAAPLPMAFGAAALLIITGGLLVGADPALAAIGFAIAPLLGFVNWYYQRRMRVAATVAQQARADVSEIAHESFDAGLVVKTLGREGAETERFRATSEDLRDKMIVVGRLRAAFDPVIEALPNVGILLVLLVGAHRVAAGALTSGDLVTFAYLFRLIALPMRVFGWLLGELPRAVVGYDRVARVLVTEDRTDYGQATGAGDGGAPISLREVHYRHPVSGRDSLAAHTDLAAAVGAPSPVATDGLPVEAQLDAVDLDAERRGITDVTFDVDAGKTVALVGATGSGKSTVASLLVRLHDPDAGAVELAGHDLRDLARDDLAASATIVFQDAFLFDDTVRENITLGLDVSDDEVEAAARLARADGFIGRLSGGYDTRVGERGSTLSGGQRQRIALARALVRRPRLLVLDDATSAVDPAVEAEILRGLSEAALPATVVLVAYRRGSIALADEVVFVEDGRVVARGRHQDLVADVPAYAHLVTAYERRDEQPTDAGAPGPRP